MHDGKERRQHTRYIAKDLSVVIRRKGLMNMFKKPFAVKSVDFSLYGMGFEVKEKFETGEILALRLRADKLEVVDVVGIVRHTRVIDSTQGVYRTGVQFDILGDDQESSAGLRGKLSKIEINIEKK